LNEYWKQDGEYEKNRAEIQEKILEGIIKTLEK